MQFSFEQFLKNSIQLERNYEEEENLNYKKVYDLSKIDTFKGISLDDKTNLLTTIKKILLSTNDYIFHANVLDITKYTLMSGVIFILFLVIYGPFYKCVILSEEEALNLNEPSIFKKLCCYSFFEIAEIIFRMVFNYLKTKRVKKLMKIYAEIIIKKNEEQSDYLINIKDSNFDLCIIKKEYLKDLMNWESKDLAILKGIDLNFFQYVINYPNSRYYKWDRKILNVKENEIANDIIKAIEVTEYEQVRQFGFSIIIMWVFYFFSFNHLIKGNYLMSLFYKFLIFILTKVFSYFMSKSYKDGLIKCEKELNGKYLPNGYFIILHICAIQIFKLDEEHIDKSLEIDEKSKNIYDQINNLNDKILNH